MTQPQKRTFTDSQVQQMRENPFTLSVSPHIIRFTYEFKLYALKKLEEPGMRIAKVFAEAGYDPKVLGQRRMETVIKRIREEAASPEGLKIPKKSREAVLSAYAERELDKQQMRTAIRLLQEKVQYLQQQMEFLKKIYQAENTPKSLD